MKGTSLVYSKKTIPLSREELIEKVATKMSQKRLKHVLRVEKTALSLAKGKDVELEKVSIAALLHDYAKERPDDESRDIIISENLDLELLKFGNNIWHGPVAAILVEKELRVEDEEVLSAIRSHTIGSIQMNLMEQILYIADYIEPKRNFPGVDEARLLAQDNLADAVAFSIQHTLAHLLKEGQLIYPKAVEVYNAWICQK